MGVGNEHEIDFRDALEAESGVALAFHRTVPFRPIRIDDDRVAGELEEKRGVADPGDADFSVHGRIEDRLEHRAAHFAEHAGDDVVAQEFRVSPWPALLRGEAGVLVSWMLAHFLKFKAPKKFSLPNVWRVRGSPFHLVRRGCRARR